MVQCRECLFLSRPHNRKPAQMFNMQDMLADMLKKSIPPEVMEKLTAENLKDIGDKATAFVADIRGLRAPDSDTRSPSGD
jgi:hypothetical protein